MLRVLDEMGVNTWVLMLVSLMWLLVFSLSILTSMYLQYRQPAGQVISLSADAR